MICLIRSYYDLSDYPDELEDLLLKYSEVKEIVSKTQNKLVEIRANTHGVSLTIDLYRAYVNINPRLRYIHINKERVGYYDNISCSKIKSVIDAIDIYLPNIEKSKVSQLHLSINFNTEASAFKIIKSNVIVHGFKYYNHDLPKVTNFLDQHSIEREMKIFDYEEFDIVLLANKSDYNQNRLRFELRIKKSRILRNYGIINIRDLKIRKNLNFLFEFLEGVVEDLVILDTIDYESINNKKDREMLRLFSTVGYWQEIVKKRTPQTRRNQYKKFMELIDKYNLDKIKKNIMIELRRIAYEILDV